MTALSHDEAARVPAPAAGADLSAGMLLALVAAATFGLSGALGRGLMDAGWSPGAAVTARVCVGALALLPASLRALRGRWHLLRDNLAFLALFGLVSVAGCQLAFFLAVTELQVGVALLVEYTAPVAIVGWLWVRYDHRPGRLTVAGGGLALLGLVLVLDLTGGASVSLVGLGWALLAMLAVSSYFVLGAQRTGSLPPIALAGGGLVVGAAALAVAGLVGLLPLTVGTAAVSFSPGVVPWWVVVLALGVLTAALSYTAGIAATRRLGSRLASFVALSEVLAAVVWAWLLVGELPHPVQLLGGVLVVAGVVVVKLGETPGR